MKHMDNKFLNKYEQKSEFKPPAKRKEKTYVPKKKKLYLGIGIGVVALVSAIVILLVVMNGKTEIPDMIGWSSEEVDVWATENKVMIRITEAYSDDIDLGNIMEQSPGPEGELEKGEFLELVVSQGPDMSIIVKLPDFTTMTKAEIDTWVEDNHMSKVRITTANSQTVEIGEVITYSVNDNTVVGDEVRRDSPIYIIISNGTGEDGNVTVPDFTIMALDAAQLYADDNGIVLEIEEVFDEIIPKDQIISQEIEVDEIIKVGDTVKLKVSKGPEIIVPDFSDYTADVASVVAGQYNIMVMVEETYSGVKAGGFISQSIPAGSLYDTNDILTLKYSIGNTILIPSFVGQGVDTLKAWATEQNAQGTNIKINTTYTTASEAPDSIITQDKADTTVGISTTVNVVVSKGKVVYVPDFVADSGVGYDQAITREKAIEMCNEAGLIPVFVSGSSSGRLEGEVWSQSIAAGKEVQQGTKITLKYTEVKSTVTVPDFTGMTKDEIEAAGYHKKLSISYEFANDGEVERVVSQSVAKGTTVAPGTTIILGGGTEVVPELE